MKHDTVKKGFQVLIHLHTDALFKKTPEDLRFIIGRALEWNSKPKLQEEIDFTLEVERTWAMTCPACGGIEGESHSYDCPNAQD